ncbi:retrotransposon protein, putative, ty1-copia subclass [Tanacetum coccineum]|uniref:Retrotransposon protein, putative, ty1-copia subclass n=1 Tax=Tanacetum coccineum TaxID=301880 RepID=A0ABQ4ZJC6_9ASTR
MQNVPYPSAVGSIMYSVRCTYPDVAFAQNITSRFQQNFGDLHWTTVKNILKYLRNTKDMFLVYGGDIKRELGISCYTDVGYLTDVDNLRARLSQSGYAFVLNGGAVDWRSAKQNIFATSSAEAEYIAASDASNKVNVHAWKVKIDSLPTRFNISRRGMDIESITCSICDNEVESSSHLFFKCNMVRDIIRKITRWWDITYIEADSYEDWLNWLVNLRLSSNYKQALEGVFYVMWWHVWQYRNKYIFEAVSSPKAMIFEDIVSRSFYWCRNRCKASFSWNDWLKNPYLVAL